MIAEAALAKLLAAGGGLVSGVALFAGITGGAQRAAVSSHPDRLATAVCSYVSPEGSVQGSVRRDADGDGDSNSRPAAPDHGTSSRGDTKRIGAGLGLTTEQAENAKVIIEVAAKLGLSDRAATIGLATALQESNLRTDAVGDDGTAFGPFQQHPEYGWGTRAQVTDTRHAARAFFSHLVKVKNWDEQPLTVAAQAVQRSAFPDAYAKHEPRAKKILAVLTASSSPDSSPETSSTARPAIPQGDEASGEAVRLPDDDREDLRAEIEAAASLGISREAVIANLAARLRSGEATGTHERPHLATGDYTQLAEKIVAATAKDLCGKLSAMATGLADIPADVVQSLASTSTRGVEAVRAALKMRGLPYSWGGGGPNGPSHGIGRGAGTKGFDCSGLTEYAWATAGARIGTTTYEQWRAGVRIPKSQLKPGDLVFYETNSARPGPDHVGLVVSDTTMVNAPYTGAVVRLDSIERPGYVGAIRPLA